MSNTFIFFHIPKTGGTSLRIHFQNNLQDQVEFIHLANKGDRIARSAGLLPFEQREPMVRNNALIILGHRVNLFTEKLLSNKTQKIVFFREPNKWLISRYNQRMNHLAKHERPLSSFQDWFRHKNNTIGQFDWFLIHGCGFETKVINYPINKKINLLISILNDFDLVLPLQSLSTAIIYFSRKLSISENAVSQNVVGLHKDNYFIESPNNIELLSTACMPDNKIYSHLSEKYFESSKNIIESKNK
jgi:hypothetical protein